MNDASHEFDLRKLHRKRSRSFLPLRAETLHIISVDQESEIIVMRPLSGLSEPQIPLVPFCKPRGKFAGRRIRKIGDCQRFLSAGNISVNLSGYGTDPADELFSARDDRLTVECQLFIQNRQRGCLRIRGSERNTLQEPVPVLKNLVIAQKLIQINAVDLTQLHIHEAPPVGRSFPDDVQILRREKYKIQHPENFT